MSAERLKIDYSWTLLLGAVAVVATTTAWGNWLVADVQKILSGQVWRLLTGSLVHSNPGHLARDLAACLILGVLYEPVFRGRFHWILLCGLVAPATVALAVHPDLSFYCGLSGTAHALMAAALVKEFRTGSGWPYWVLVVGGAAFVFKLVYEAATGSLLLPLSLGSNVRPVPVAHLAGAVVGGVMGYVFTDRLVEEARGERGLRTRPVAQ
jgi:rhomboid family GlyGly-CTERM serine protease